MPGSSYPYFKSKLKDYLKKKYSDKISILDVGAGEGVYSNLLRDMTNVMDAIEVFPLNIEVEQLHTKYDVVYETDIVKFKYTKKYDVIIFGDILEHLSVEDSKKVLKDALKNSKQIIIAVPYLSEQEISYGNKYEQHKQTDLTDSIFLNRYPEFETLFKNELYGYYTNKGMVPTVEKKLKIAFLDTIGLKYNGDTLKEKGLGGSESAIIYLGKELTKLGFEVTVFNKCDREGVYDGVEYVDLSKTVYNVENYDILITSRTVLPYIPLVHRDTILQRYQGYDIANYKPLVDRSKYKVMWLHDTFILGEEWVENALADNFYDEIFTLSDWHTQYIVNANHGQEPRFFESMKRKIFQTRNGIKSYYDEVDISKKDKNLFIYNASATKGMVPLLDSIWPRVHAEYPSAKLLIIGGYYPGAASKGPDHIENIFHEKVAQNEGKRNVHFTGIIKQNEIADILVKASFFIYPGAFPETFGISATEALNYNVPLIASRFGALEETAPESTSYLAEYPIIRNMSNFNDNGSVADPSQVERFLIKVKQAYEDDFLRQQKMNAANEFKPFLGWDTVALQWKHHFYNKLDLYMPRKELEDVRYVTGNLHRLYNRRFFNKEDFIEDYSLDHKNEIVIISPLYNAKKYVEKCISSVASQLYNNYTHYIIDDLSTDNTADVVIKAIKNLPINIRDKFIFIKNTEKRNAVGNQVETIKKLHGDPIIALLDGDDRLKNDPDIFNYINREYNRGIKFTYGSFFSMADRVESIAQPYPHHVHKNKSYRNHKFNWGLPYTHLRTFKKSVFDKVDKSVFKDPNGNYWAAGGDNSMFYPLIEQCEENEIRAVQRILVMYNDMSPLNDFRVNAKEQNNNRDMIVNNNKKEEEVIVNKPTKAYIMRMPKNTISVEYAKQAAESCERIGLPYDYYDSYDHVTPNELWGGNNKYGITFYDSNMHPGAASATAGHFDLWEKIRDNKETAIILEHDAIMLHPINISIPDGMIVNLGYKLKNPDQYDHISAGAPKNIVDIASQCGAHAYAITSKTAGMLLEELKDVGALMAIDNFYFSREDKKQSSIPIGMVNPIGAIAWVKKTTIVWDKEEAWEINSNFIYSFINNLKTEYKGDINDGYVISLGYNTKLTDELRNSKNPKKVEYLKQFLKDREQVWIDNTESIYIGNRLSWLLNKIDTYPRKSKILDIGAWTGAISNEVFKKGFSDITCLDISEKVVELGKHTFPQFKWLQEDIEKFTTDEKYDIVFMGEILEHLADPIKTINKVKSFLSETGVIIFTIPTEEYVFQPNSHEHISCITLEQLKDLTDDLDVIRLSENNINYAWNAGSIKKNYTPTTSEIISPQKNTPVKNILIAFPTAKNIETDTFLSVYRLDKPDNVNLHLECFYGYNIDQVRNLIAHYAIQNNFDYVLFVDYDMILPKDTLTRLLSYDKDIISGVYIQRWLDKKITEVYLPNENGSLVNVTDPNVFKGKDIMEVFGIGFGCVLVNTQVLRDIGYPQFKYTSSIDFNQTISEDVDFCVKAIKKGYKIHVLPGLLYEHISSIKLKF